MTVSASFGHRIWAPYYDEGPNPLLALESRLLQPLLDKCPPGRVIDVACGTGRWMRFFNRSETNVFGVDISPEMLQQAGRHHGLRTRLVLGDVLHLPFADASASLVLCSFALGYIGDLRGMFAEISRLTEIHGTVVVSDLHPEALAAGWTRSFKVDGCSYDIECSAHSEAAILHAAACAGLTFENKMHACLGWPEFAIIQDAGKAASFEQLFQVPAIWSAIWKKPC